MIWLTAPDPKPGSAVLHRPRSQRAGAQAAKVSFLVYSHTLLRLTNDGHNTRAISLSQPPLWQRDKMQARRRANLKCYNLVTALDIG